MNEYIFIILAVLATGGRVIGLILLSILSGWLLAYAAIKSKIFENLFISFIEVFESVPVISFFPIVLIIFVDRIGGPLGVEFAADFLVFTAVVWNIWMGQYQAYKTIPSEMVEVTENYNFSLWMKLRNVYIPFSIPRIVANLFPSISDGFFYITVSEVIWRFFEARKRYSIAAWKTCFETYSINFHGASVNSYFSMDDSRRECDAIAENKKYPQR